MNPQTRIYFKLKQVNVSGGTSDNLKMEIRLNEDTLSLQVLLFIT